MVPMVAIAPNTLVVIRHGIFSSAASMQSLEREIRKILTLCSIDNQDYRWEDPILHSGIALADHVLSLSNTPAIEKIVFVGHSQGGLVCRVAVAALVARSDLLRVESSLKIGRAH